MRKSRRDRGFGGVFAAATVAVCVGLAAAPALAQGGGGGRGGDGEGGGRRFQGGGGAMMTFGGGMGGRFGMSQDPVMTSRDLPRYGQILGLTQDQQEAAGALLEAYQLEVQTHREAMQQAQEEMREAFRAQREEGGEGPGQEAFAKMRESTQKFRAEKKKLDTTYMSDLKSLLTPEQEANWPVFERVHRRETQIQRGLMSGERVDVVKLVEDAKLPAESMAEVSPVLAQYEEELDRELQNREKVQEDLSTRMGDLGRGEGGPDMEAIQRMISEGRDASRRVRDVNRKYARQVQELLPETAQFAFAKAVKEASYPDVYRETYATRALASAAGLADVDATQKEGIEAIRTDYARDVAVLNDKIASAQEEMEENFSLERMREGGNDDLRELRRQKRELDEATVENLKKLLTPEQQERLPQQERRGRGGDGGRGGRGGDGDGEAPRRRSTVRPDNRI